MANIVSPFEDPEHRLAAGRFGMLIFIASLAMIFAGAILGFLVVRLEDEGTWPPPGMPSLPWSLLFSTVVLVASSVTFLRATGALRRDDGPGLVRWLSVTLMLALVFLTVQDERLVILRHQVAVDAVSHGTGIAEDTANRALLCC